MATLTLNVLRSPEHVPVQQRVVQGGELTVGRSDDCDWTLRDPARSLSRRHCTFSFRGGAWQVLDLSANGTFLNGAADPIGRGHGQAVRHGDRISLGDYDVEIQIGAEDTLFAQPSRFGAAPAADHFAGAPRPAGFGNARLPGLDDPGPERNPFGAGGGSGNDAGMGSGMGAGLGMGFGSSVDISSDPDPVMPDNAPSTASAFVPPQAQQQPARQLVPDDWFHDVIPSPPPAVPAPAQAAPPRPAAPTTPTPGPALATTSTPAAADSPFGPPGLQAPLPQALLQDPGVSPAAPPRATAPLAAAAGTGAAEGLQALLEGSRLEPDLVARTAADPAGTLRNAGALLRVAVGGMRKLLVSRGAVKREFRIEQTILQTRENNPLKFAASDEQALAALLDPRTSSVKAVQDSIDDLSVHQVAVLAATQAAARALLEQLAPDTLLAADPGGGLLPGAQEKRLWEAYKQRHARLLLQFEDDFESAFGRAFAKAYEQAVSRDKG